MAKKQKKKPVKTKSRKVSSKKGTQPKLPFRKYFLAFLFLFSCVLYANTLGHQYAFDDSIVITENPYTQAGISGIPKLLTSDFFEGIYGYQTDLAGGRYRPLSLMSFAVEYQFFGMNPMIGHLFNIVYYGLVLLMLFLVLEQWFGKESIVPFLASLIFLVHPLHTEVVANIKSRDEILGFLFLLLSLYYLFRNDGVKNLVLSALFYFVSLLAKETGITYVVIFPLVLYVFRNENINSALKKTAPLTVVALVYFMVRTAIVGSIGGGDSADIMENPFVNSPFAEKYATIFCHPSKVFPASILSPPVDI